MGAAVAAASRSKHAAVCAAVVEHPDAAAATEQLHALASSLACPVPLPVSPTAAPGTASKCRTLFAFAQLGLGLLAPLLADCLTTARLFAAHQAQRRAVRLPAEGGVCACVLAATWRLSLEGFWLPCLLLSWILFSMLWHWTALFAA